MNSKHYVSGLTAVLLALSGCSSSAVWISSSQGEDFIRSELLARTDVGFLVDCPEDLSGSNGDRFTCYACPQGYVAAEPGGGYFYGDGSVEFRCDAAYEGFAVDLLISGSDYVIDFDSLREANLGATSTSSGAGASGTLDAQGGEASADESAETFEPIENSLFGIRAWAESISATQWSPFQSYVENCNSLACGYVDLVFSYEPREVIEIVDVVMLSGDQQVGRFDLRVGAGERSSLVSVELSGVSKGGVTDFELLLFEAFSGEQIGTAQIELDVKLSAIESMFAENRANFENWTYGGNVQLSDPFIIARQLEEAGVCDAVSQDGSRVRCSRGLNESPAYDAYIYTFAADIVWQSLVPSRKRTVFFSPSWAVDIRYPGWTASDTDIIQRMESLDWEVLMQDYMDPLNCVGSCFVARQAN